MKASPRKTKQNQPQLRTYVAESVREVLDDPDFGLTLSERATHRLQLASKKSASSQKRTNLKTIVTKYS